MRLPHCQPAKCDASPQPAVVVLVEVRHQEGFAVLRWRLPIRTVGFAVLALAPCCSAAECDAMAALRITRTTITSTTAVAAGAFSATGAAVRDYPEFCRVQAVARPVDDSEIRMEIWLPAKAAWNGKLLGTGNGGFSGALSYGEMESGLRQGYATAGSDTGHSGGDLAFGQGHPEKINDWAWRAVHVMTETAKLVARNYYGRFPEYSYFSGCSTGGHQALTEAQRFPEDYDGILAGAPGNNRVRLMVGFLWSWLALNRVPGAALPPSKLAMLHRAVMASCDARDGLKDGLIDDPRRCKFDPSILLCSGPDGPGCLTAGEVAAVKAIYAGARNPRSGERLFSGWAPGSEGTGAMPDSGWAAYFVGRAEPARLEFWRLWVFQDPAWDPRTFDFDRDVAFADAKMAFLVANDPNLSAFRKRGGKLLLYQGWADPVTPPENTIEYFSHVQAVMGGPTATSGFLRLFLAPGMGHCAGGSGPNRFDGLSALDDWVARGRAPDRIVATHSEGGKVDRTRPLCPYPLVARWNGKGSSDDAAQFACVAPGANER